ncbi:MAG: hypothetical protein WCA29_08795 [Jiangellales bacterium]
MNLSKLDTQDYVKIASTGFALYTVLKTIRTARHDDDGLQLMEALLRGATLALSVAVIVRNIRHLDDEQSLEA